MRLRLALSLLAIAALQPAPPAAAGTDMMTVTGIEIGKPGGRIVFPTLGDPKTFNVVTANETSSTEIVEIHIFEGLIDYDPHKREITPWLAKSWEHSEDYLTWTFHLRKGVQWSDGQPFTADDVLFSFEVVYDPNVPNSHKDFLQVKGENFVVEKADDHTVTIKLAAVYGPFERVISTALRIIPKHKLGQAHRDGNFNEAYSLSTPPQDIVGTGPFRLKSFLSGERTVLERNPYYWKQDEQGTRLPYLDEIVFLALKDLDAWDVSFEAGKTDAHGVNPDKYKRFKDMEASGNFTIHDLGESLGTDMFWFNQHPGKNPQTGAPFLDPVKYQWFSNVKFRQAISHSINRRGILRNVYRGRAVELYSPLPASMGKWHNPNSPKFEYDPEKAKALLEALGMKDRDGDGIREDEAGNKIRFTYITNRENEIRERIGVILKEGFREVGLDATLKLVDFNTLVTALNDTFDYEACLLGFTGSDVPLTGLNLYRSSGRLHTWYPAQETPATPWEARVDELIEMFLAEPEEEKQVGFWHEIQDLYGENQPVSFTVNPIVYLAVRNKFGNVKPVVIRPRLLWNSSELFVK